MSKAATETSDDTDELLSILADGRRRTVLRSLEEATGNERPVGALAEDVVDSIDGDGPADQPLDQRIATELHHNHLPVLEEMELIVHDRDAGVVLGDADESALELLALIEQYEQRQ